MRKLLIAITLVLLLSGCTSPKVSIELIPSVDNIEVFDQHVVKGCILTIGETEYPMKIESNNVNTKVLGTYTIDYYYDIEDQHYVCQRYVFVTDNTPPYLELLPGLDTIQLGTTWIDGGIDIMDNYYTDTFTVTVEHQINTSVVGDYLVVYTVADEDGNENTIERMIHVVE